MSPCKNFSQKCVRFAVFIFLVAACDLAAQAQVVFSPPKNISNSSGNTQSQQIAVDGNGNVNLVWADNSLGKYAIFFSRSSDAGNTFSTPRSISKHAQSTARSPLIAVDSTGNICVAWTENSPDGSANFIYFSHSTNGVTFTNPQNISGDAGAATSPQIAVDSGGNINIVWADTSVGNSEVFFSRSRDGGTTFSTPLNLSNDAGDSANPQIAADASGNINVAWQDDTPGVRYDVFFSRSTDGGTSFSAPLSLTQSNPHSFVSLFPLQIAAGSNGNIYVLWVIVAPNLSSFRTVKVNRSTDGGATFSLFSSLSFSSSGKMALDPSGSDIGIASTQDIDTGFPFVEFSLTSDRGFSGFAGPEISDTPNIAVDAIGRFDMLYNAYEFFGNGFHQTPCLCFAQSPGSGATITSQPADGPTAMALDPGGNVHVAWLQSATSGSNANVFFSRGTAPPFSFSISKAIVVGGSDSPTGTLKLIAPAPAGGAVISLSSSNPSAVSVPASVTVPEGGSSATFTITTNAVSSNTTATITASFNGTNVATLTVEPLFVFGFFGNLTGGQTLIGDIFLRESAPSGGLVIDLSSSDPSVASVPASVTVPAGSTFATFNIPTTPVSRPTTIEVTGTTNGFSQTGAFTVQPPVLQQLSLSTSPVTGGNFTTLTVTLNGPAPAGGAVVSLSSGNPSVVSTPASVTVAAGSTSGSVNINASAVSTTTQVTISASLNGATRTTSLAVLSGPVVSVGWQCFRPSPCSQVIGGATITANALLTGQAPSGGFTVFFSSSNPSVVTAPASVTVPAGASSATFTMTTSSVSASTAVWITYSYTTTGQSGSGSSSITVNP